MPKYTDLSSIGTQPQQKHQLDNTITSIDKISTLVDKGVKFMELVNNAIAVKNGIQKKDNSQIDIKAQKEATRIINENPPLEKQIFIETDNLKIELVNFLNNFAEANPDKTIKEFLEIEIKQLDENGTLIPLMENFLKKYVRLK